MNSLTLSGIITGDPQVFAPEGSESTKITFNIANNDNSKKVNGQYEKDPMFLNVSYWTKKPQYWLNLIAKGSKCSFVAPLRMESWEKDGIKQSKLVAEIPSFSFPEITPKISAEPDPF